MMPDSKRNWKVGELAKGTGVTVRTLHHYEEIGLLRPSARSESGHRVYSKEDLERLQQIVSLKQLGFPLEEIRGCLDGKNLSPLQIVRLHKKRVLEDRERLSRLHDQLAVLERALAENSRPSVEQLFKTIEVMTMYEKYFTQEQLAELKQKEDTFGQEKMKEYQDAWTSLMERVRAEMRKKTDPSSAAVQALAREWSSLVQAFTGGNPRIEVQLGSMYRNEPAMRQNVGMEPELWEYVTKMMAYSHKL